MEIPSNTYRNSSGNDDENGNHMKKQAEGLQPEAIVNTNPFHVVPQNKR